MKGGGGRDLSFCPLNQLRESVYKLLQGYQDPYVFMGAVWPLHDSPGWGSDVRPPYIRP